MRRPNKDTPPRLALWLLERMVWRDDYEYAAGDFEELYRSSARTEGAFRAACRCWLEVLRSLPGFINNSLYWGSAMFRNYLIVALRNLARQKGFSSINIAGLAVGVACCLIISLWVYSQLSIDRFHESSGQIYQILAHGEFKNNPSIPAPLGPTLADEFPQVAYATRYENLGNRLVGSGSESFYEPVRAVDASFFRVFSFEFVRGDRDDAFPAPNSAVITEDLAHKYFGAADPVGRTITLDSRQSFAVSAVVADPPVNSSLKFRILVPFAVKEAEVRESTGREMGWGWFSPQTFVRLSEGTDAAAFEALIMNVVQTHSDEKNLTLGMLPFTRRYLFLTGGYMNIYLFASIGVLILIIASINFVNLSTARSARRAREVGLRKVVGAFRSNIIHQFLGETVVTAALAVTLAVIIVMAVLPGLNAAMHLQLNLKIIPITQLAPALLGLIVILGTAAGCYPAWLVSRYQPAHVVKGKVTADGHGSRLRRLLVVVQFAISAILVFGTAVILRQVGFSLGANLGYDREHIITVPLIGVSRQYATALKNELARDARILGAVESAQVLPEMTWTSSRIDWNGKRPSTEVQVAFNSVDFGFVETMGLKMAEGRPFSDKVTSDARAYLVNETLARMVGGQSVVGQQLTFWNKSGEIIGVMKDFHFLAMTDPIGPMLFLVDESQFHQMTIRLSSDDPMGALAFVRETWEKTVPSYPFQHTFVADNLRALYADAADMGRLLGLFAGLALFVACLGVLGFAASNVSSRAREIAVRKVLGAGAGSTIALLSRELAGCLLIANLVAGPVGYLLMSRWLEDYNSRISIGASLLLLPLVITGLAAGLAVTWQTIKAVRANPIEPLRTE